MSKFPLWLLLAALPLQVVADDVPPVEEVVPRHEGSGMAFPAQVAGFKRARLMRFDEAGRDAGVDYNFHDENRSIHATVFIYPPAGDTVPSDALERNMVCTQELDRRKAELHTVHPESTLSPVKPAQLEADDHGTRSGYHISFNSYEQYGSSPQNVSSDLYLFCFAMDDWMLSYRFTYPAKTDVAEPIRLFMRELPWAR